MNRLVFEFLILMVTAGAVSAATFKVFKELLGKPVAAVLVLFFAIMAFYSYTSATTTFYDYLASTLRPSAKLDSPVPAPANQSPPPIANPKPSVRSFVSKTETPSPVRQRHPTQGPGRCETFAGESFCEPAP
jgi:hypothetical protein